MSNYNLSIKILAYDDPTATSNPKRRLADWSREFYNLPVDAASPDTIFVPPLSSVTAFSGTRTLGINAATEFSVLNLDANTYRLKWTGTGAAPAFRTTRTVAVSGGTITTTIVGYRYMTVTSSLGSVFGAVVVGDNVMIPGVSTFDTGPFNAANEGLWQVQAASGTSLSLVRATGEGFNGASETVSVSNNLQFQVYSAAGVQSGDILDLVSGYLAGSLTSYNVVGVTARQVDFASTFVLVDETVVPGVTSTYIYSSAKRNVYLETNQPIVVQANGDTTDCNRVTPMAPGDDTLVGPWFTTGPVFSLVLKNKSTETAKVTLIATE